MPIAGLAKRMLPYSAVTPKAMLPLVRGDVIRPVMHWILADVKAAGIDEVCLVASPGQPEIIERYCDAAAEAGAGDLPEIRIDIQDNPAGFGAAVLQAAEFVGDESFAVLLGDHAYAYPGERSCIQQVAGAYRDHPGAAMIGVQTVPETELLRVGTAAGERITDNVYRCTRFVEKPSVQVAGEQLRTSGLDEGQYLAHCGIYVFQPVIFDCLREVAGVSPTDGELELSAAQSVLLDRCGESYYLCRISGRAFDVGSPRGYAGAQEAFGAQWG